MMRKLLAALSVFVGLAASPAYAQGCGDQNPNCIVPTRPTGDSSNAAASTAFVGGAITNILGTPNTWTALQTFNGGANVPLKSPGDSTGAAASTEFVGQNAVGGLPIANVLNFGVAACTGSTDASAAVATAISAGFFRVYLPAGCSYQPPSAGGNETIPSGITIIGQNADPNLGNVSLVRTANRATSSDAIQLGARSSVQAVAIQSFFCDQSTNPLATTKVCPLGIGYNSGDQAEPLTNWPYQPAFYITGTTTSQPGATATDTPILALEMNNQGDALFTVTSGGGVSHRVWTGGTSGDQGILIQNAVGGSPANVHTGLHCLEAGTNSASSCITVERGNGATAPMFLRQDDGPGTATTVWDQWLVQFQSSGLIRNTFQTTTPFSGTFDFINAGNSGGTFTGSFVNYQIASVSKFAVDNSGNVTASGNITALGTITSGTTGTAGLLTLNGSTSGTAKLTTGATGGHFTYAGSGSAPTLTAGCNGTGGTISGTDTSGTVGNQTAAATSCTVTFGTAFSTAPRCTASGHQAAPTTVVPSTGTLVINFTSTAGAVFDWTCYGT